jgi:tRNA(Ile)-lysidine synthase
MLEAVVRKVLVEECDLNKGEKLIVAVSGGADSLGLLMAVKNIGLPVIAAHFNHHLRQISDYEASGLQQLAEDWGIPLIVGEGDVKSFANREKLGVEEAARQCRYQFLFTTAKDMKARAILTAHHADDQVETILMHFLRGAGFNGLEGMRRVSYLRQFSTEIPIWRPLLDVSKDEILRYCEEHKLEFFEDESNADTSFFRNSLRHRLIPEIENLAPKFRQTILRNAQAIQKDNDRLQAHSSFPEENLDPQISIDALSFSRDTFIQAMPGDQTTLLKRSILALEPSLRDIGYEKLVQLAEKIYSPTRRTEVGHGLVMQVKGDEVIIQREGKPVRGYPQIDSEVVLNLEQLPRCVELQNGYFILLEVIPWEAYEEFSAAIKSDPAQAFLSRNSAGVKLAIQKPFTGLRWQPLGMATGSQKLSDTFVNVKIPQAARAKYPVVVINGEVAWVPGLRIAHNFRLKEKEPQVLHLELQKNK